MLLWAQGCWPCELKILRSYHQEMARFYVVGIHSFTKWVIFRRVNGKNFMVLLLLDRDSWTSRYANMDFIFFSSLIGFCTLMLTVSYDICCQWSQNLVKRWYDCSAYMIRTTTLQTPQYKTKVRGEGNLPLAVEMGENECVSMMIGTWK